MKIMRCNCLPLATLLQVVFLSTTPRFLLAIDIPEPHATQPVDRTLQESPSTNDESCNVVCDDTTSTGSGFSFDQIQVVEVEVENEGFLARLFDRFDGIFDRKSTVGGWMSGIWNIFRRRRRNKRKFEIKTDAIVPILTTYSTKAKSLAALLRRESATYEAVSTTPDVIKMIFELSAENMESIASVIDPMLHDMSQNATMDLATFSCSFGDVLTHIQRQSIPNIVSMAKFIYTKSGDAKMQAIYDNYVAASSKPSSNEVLLTEDDAVLLDTGLKQCPDVRTLFQTATPEMMLTQSSEEARVGTIGDYLLSLAVPLGIIVGLVILFPLSFIISFVALFYVIGRIILAVVFKQPLIEQGEPDPDCDFACDLDDLLRAIGVVALIFLPIFIPIGIIGAVAIFILSLLNPLFGSLDPPTVSPSTPSPVFPPPPPFLLGPVNPPRPPFVLGPVNVPMNPPTFSPFPGPVNVTTDVMQKVWMVLESSVENMGSPLKDLFRNKETEESARDCQMKNMSCVNDALMAAFTF